jgi:hypothetical protein
MPLRWLTAGLLVAAALCDAAAAQSTGAATEPVIRRLIRQLGAEDFDQRQTAAERLIEIGPDALPLLEEARATSSDEVRSRAGRLVQQLVREHHERGLALLLTRAHEAAPRRLPGWDEFSRVAGDAPEARQLFASMLRLEPELMGLIGGDEERLRAEIDARLAEWSYLAVQSNARHASVETVSALLLATLADDTDRSAPVPQRGIFAGRIVTPSSLSMILPTILKQGPFSQAASEDASTAAPLRRLLAEWVQRPTVAPATERMHIGAIFTLAECVTPARQLMQEGTEDRRSLESALLLLARYGTLELVPELETHLDDETPFSNSTLRGVKTEIRVQDTTLLALVLLTKQDPQTYGFPAPVEHDIHGYSQTSAKLESDAARTKAQAQWRKWRALHLRPMLPFPIDAVEGIPL